MASFLQEPDIRTLVAITECVYAMRQQAVTSCTALEAIAENKATTTRSSPVPTERIDVLPRRPASRKHSDSFFTSRHATSRKSNEAPLSIVTAPAPTYSLSSTSDEPQRRQHKRAAVPSRLFFSSRVAPPGKDIKMREEEIEADVLFNVEESSLRYAWPHEVARHSTRRDPYNDSIHGNYASMLENGFPWKKGLAYEKRSARGRQKERRTRPLDTYPLLISAIPSEHAAQTKNSNAVEHQQERQGDKERPHTAKPKRTATTSISFSKHNEDNAQSGGDDGDPKNRRQCLSSGRPSTYSSINLSEVKPLSVTASAPSAPPYAENYEAPSSSFSPRLPISLEHLRREDQARSRPSRASASVNTAASALGTRSTSSLKEEDKEGDKISEKGLPRNGTRQHSSTEPANATPIPCGQSASPLTVTAAAVHREGNVVFHGMGLSHVSIRSDTCSLSGQNSPVPSAPPVPKSASLFYTRTGHGERQGSGSMRRDHQQHEDSQRTPIRYAIAPSNSETRASLSAAQFVMDSRRRLSLQKNKDERPTDAPLRLTTTSVSCRPDEGRPLLDSDDYWAAPFISLDAAEGRKPKGFSHSNVNRTPTRKRYMRYTTAAAGLGMVCSVNDSRHLSSTSSPSRLTPCLASPPQKADRPLYHQSSQSLVSPRPSHITEENSAAIEMLRTAVHKMQRASREAMNKSSVISPPGRSSAEDRYALLVESARLLSSSALVFAALTPGDNQGSASAARSADAAYDTTTPVDSPNQTSCAVPLPRKEPLSYPSTRSDHRPTPLTVTTSLLPDHARTLEQEQKKEHKEQGGDASTHSAAVRKTQLSVEQNSQDRQSSEGQRVHPQITLRSPAEDAETNKDASVTVPLFRRTQTSKQVNVDSSSTTNVSSRRSAMPAPDRILETSQASCGSADLLSPPMRSIPFTDVAAATAAEEKAQVRDAHGVSSPKYARKEEVLVNLQSHMEDDSHDVSYRSHCCSTEQEAATIKPAILSSKPLFYEGNGKWENKGSNEAHEGSQELRRQRRYFMYVTPDKAAQQQSKGRGVPLRAQLESPPVTSPSVSPLKPTSLGSPDGCCPVSSDVASQRSYQGEFPSTEHNMKTNVADEQTIQLEQPRPSPRSPHHSKTVYVGDAKNATAASAAPRARSSDEEVSTASNADRKEPKREDRVAAEWLERGQHASNGRQKIFLEACEGILNDGRNELAECIGVPEHAMRLADRYTEQDDDTDCRPRRSGVLHRTHRANSTTTPTNSTSFSHAQLTQSHSAESEGPAFDWIAEDFAAAQQRYSDGSISLSRAPSALESPTSAGHFMTGSSLQCRHSSPSFPIETLSSSEFSAAEDQRMRHSMSNSNSEMPTYSLGYPHIPNGQHLHESNDGFPTHPVATSLSFNKDSLATVGLASSTRSAECTPTASSMMNAQEMLEMPASESQIPHEAAFFSDPPPVNAIPTIQGPPPPLDKKEENEVEGGGQDVFWVDASGHYFTHSHVLENREDAPQKQPSHDRAKLREENREDAPALNGFYAASPTPLLTAHGNQKTVGSNVGYLTVSSASTSAGWLEFHHNSADKLSERRRTVPLPTSSPSPIRATIGRRNDSGTGAATPREDMDDNAPWQRSNRSTNNCDEPYLTRRSPSLKEDDKTPLYNSQGSVSQHAKEIKGQERSDEKEQRKSRAVMKEAAEAHSFISGGTVSPSHASIPFPDRGSSSSRSSHFPPPLPRAKTTVPCTHLSVPSTLSKPPIAPKSGLPRLAMSLHARGTLSYTPQPLMPTPALDAGQHGQAFTEDADFFDEEDEEDGGYCSYGYDGEYIDV